MVRCSLAQLLKGVCAADNAASQRIIANQRAEHEWLREVMRDAALTDQQCLEDDQRKRRDWARQFIQMLHMMDESRVLRRAIQDFKPRPPKGSEFDALNPSRALRTLIRRRLIAQEPKIRKNALSLTRAGLAMARRLGLTSDIVDLDRLWPPPKAKDPEAVRRLEALRDWQRRRKEQQAAVT